MRVFLLCAGFFYFGAACDDTALVKPSQPPSLQEVLDNSLPEWMVRVERPTFGD
jgi:hypothetical protein